MERLGSSNVRAVEWIDAARGLAIVFVVVGHVWRGLFSSDILVDRGLFIAVDNALYLFHVPLFFLLSGIVFLPGQIRRGFWVGLKHRIVTLLYPFLLWSYVSGTLRFVGGSATNRGEMSVTELLTYPFPPKDVYWFLWALFLVQSAMSILVALGVARSGLAMAAGALGVIAWSGILANTLLIGSAVTFAPFFFLGALVPREAELSPRLLPLAIAVFGVSQWWAISLNEVLEPWTAFPASLAAVSGFVVLVMLATPRLPAFARSALATLGKFSMAIFVAHVIIAGILRVILVRLGVENAALHLTAGVAAGILGPMIMLAGADRLGFSRLLGLGAVGIGRNAGRQPGGS